MPRHRPDAASAGSAPAGWATRWPSGSRKGGADVTVWNRTRRRPNRWPKARAKIADRLAELADLRHRVLHGVDLGRREGSRGRTVGLAVGGGSVPRIVVECSSISLEGSAELRALLAARGVELLAAPVSRQRESDQGGPAVVRLLGTEGGIRRGAAAISPMIAPAAIYVGEGELARIVKICHNVFLGVVTQSLAEITVLAQKAGVPRHAFLEFMNQSVMGSTFSRYKTPAFVNLDFKVTFTPQLLRKDLDLGLDAAADIEVPMPLASHHPRPRPDADRQRVGRRGFRQAARAAGAGVGARRSSRRTCR